MSCPTEGISGILYIGGGGGAGIAMNVAMTMGKGDWMSTGILEMTLANPSSYLYIE